MRAVADTNVYISALNFGGTAEEVLALGRAEVVELFVSPSILKEIEGVLIRKFQWSAKRARQAIAATRSLLSSFDPRKPSTSSQRMSRTTASSNVPLKPRRTS